jgi:hypothetical protein
MAGMRSDRAGAAGSQLEAPLIARPRMGRHRAGR